MRIIAGQLKGRRLASFKGQHIRPTTDRVKESIFNKLQGLVEEARVLDLFAGTGNLGLEAASRGAQAVKFIDHHPQAIRLVRKNIDLLLNGHRTSLRTPQKQRAKKTRHTGLSAHTCDVFKFLQRHPTSQAFNLIFIDPPFTQKIGHRVMQAVSHSAQIDPQAHIVIEAGRHEQLQQQYASFKQYDYKNYGDKQVAYYRAHYEESTA